MLLHKVNVTLGVQFVILLLVYGCLLIPQNALPK